MVMSIHKGAATQTSSHYTFSEKNQQRNSFERASALNDWMGSGLRVYSSGLRV